MKAGHFNRPINRQIQYNMTTEIEEEKEKLKAAIDALDAAADDYVAVAAYVAARADYLAALDAADDVYCETCNAAYEDYKNKLK
mgnify:CR=1 FL=1